LIDGDLFFTLLVPQGETKLADVHSHRTTAQGSQITTDSTHDGHRGKTSTLPKKENQGAAVI
jgi:hypothetical protein